LIEAASHECKRCRILDGELELSRIRRAARKMKKRSGLDCLILDYDELIEAPGNAPVELAQNSFAAYRFRDREAPPVSWCMAQIQCLGFLFDLDGVLVDSTPAVARCWTKWAIQHGFKDPEEIVRIAHGRPSIATLRELLPNGDYEAENRQMERWEIEDLSDVVALPGARQLLQTLPADRLAIVTSCTRPLAEVRIRAGGLPQPKQLITSNDIRRGKPDPEPYLKGAAALGLAPADCIVVEDAPAGIRSGKAAGTSVLALRTTDVDAELSAAGARWIINDLSFMRLGPANSNSHIELSFLDAAHPQPDGR